MWIYVSTVKSIGNVPDKDILAKQSDSRIVLFYNDSEMLKVSDVGALYEKSSHVDLIAIADRDDMLISIGMMLAEVTGSSDSKLIFLDDTISVPKKYENKIQYIGDAVKSKGGTRIRRTRTKSGAKGNQKSDQKVNAVVESENNMSENVSSDVMNPPESDVDASIGANQEFESKKKD